MTIATIRDAYYAEQLTKEEASDKLWGEHHDFQLITAMLDTWDIDRTFKLERECLETETRSPRLDPATVAHLIDFAYLRRELTGTTATRYHVKNGTKPPDAYQHVKDLANLRDRITTLGDLVGDDPDPDESPF